MNVRSDQNKQHVYIDFHSEELTDITNQEKKPSLVCKY